MGRYDEDLGYSANANARQRDVVLSSNEYCYIQSKTNGIIKVYSGPCTITISGQETIVTFNNRTKRFEETNDFEKARKIFTSAPEGWYVVLKNPAKDDTHPESAKAITSPELEIGRKVNIAGPCSFSLYPGQMAKVVQGHRLRSNQYLLARVYDAEAAGKSIATIVDAEGKEVNTKNTYFVGQMLVIKGTEVSFYMPPTGIEVIADGDTYVRDAVTLERLEYSILKDEDGEKRYLHGPAVVFPEPTETFVSTPKGGVIFRALELSPISGIYIKVIAEYKEDDGTERHIGDELFITGNDQMIYYPRPEHAMIQYDGKYMHHAIAIPEGEGRYILNRLTGDIKTVVGPAMYLPDPRTEVVVKRKLTEKECKLYYPGNTEVINYNNAISEKSMERHAAKGLTASSMDMLNTAYATSKQEDTLAIFEANANISRGVSYTKPRTITLDTKYDGVVAINVWNGYAVCVVSKSGKREVVVGPKTRLLDYDETLEIINTPEGETVYLKLKDNKVSDTIIASTSDFVDVQIELVYNVNFKPTIENKEWFSVYNYSKFIADWARNQIKREVKKYTIQEFYSNSIDIIRAIILTSESGECDFEINSSVISDLEIKKVLVEKSIAAMISKYQEEIIAKNLELSTAKAQMSVLEALAENEKKQLEMKNTKSLFDIELENRYEQTKLAKEAAIAASERAEFEATQKAKEDLQPILNKIHEEELAREKAKTDAEIAKAKEMAEIEKAKQKAYAETVKEIMSSIQPGLVEAINSNTQAELANGIGKAVSPYVIANGNESIADVITKMLRGTSLENIVDKISK